MKNLWNEKVGRRLLIADLCVAIVFPLAVLSYAVSGPVKGAWLNHLITFCVIALIVLGTWTLVRSCRLGTPLGTVTPWKRIGKYAIAIWLTGIVLRVLAVLLIDTPIGPVRIGGVIASYSIALAAALVWFPIWTVVNAIRGRRDKNWKQNFKARAKL